MKKTNKKTRDLTSNNMLTRLKSNRSGGMEISFGIIFSIILIVVFIVVAIIAINYVLGIQKCSQVNMFASDFQDAVKTIWISSQSPGEIFKDPLPSGIQKVCFANLSAGVTGDENIYNELKKDYSPNANLFFYPAKNSCNNPYREISHINISDLSNPYCFDNPVGIKLEKGFFDALVRVEKA